MPKEEKQDEKAPQDSPKTAPKDPDTEKKADQPKPSLEGLVKMKRDGRIIHAHPTTVHDHVRNGWKEV